MLGNNKKSIGFNNSLYNSSGSNVYVGILNLYPNASAAYSLRLLKNNYIGNAVRIRRSGDNSETDIGFLSNGNFNVLQATAFCIAGGGTQNGFVVTWFDQSGNSNNATQIIAANQPQIVSNGNIISINSKASINFDGNDLLLKNGVALNTVITSFSVYKNTSLVGNPNVFSTGLIGISTSKAFGLNSGTGLQRIFAGSSLSFNVSSIINTHYLGYNLYAGGSSQIAINGSLAIVGDAGTNSNTDLSIGAGLAASNFMIGLIQEIIFYSTNRSTNKTAIETNINQYYGIY
jgi:hypothetical protein